jgi:hypothetical protein
VILIDGPTIPQLARKIGVPRRTMFRRLMAVHAKDRREKAERGEPFIPWLYKYAEGPWRVNLPRLRREHPEMAGVASNAELEERLRRLEDQLELLDGSQRTLVKRVRDLIVA